MKSPVRGLAPADLAADRRERPAFTLAKKVVSRDGAASKSIARKFRAPSGVAVAPLMVSQVNCEAAFGLKPWRFLELIAEQKLPHHVEGKTKFVTAEVLMDALTDHGEPEEAPADERTDAMAKSLRMFGRKAAP
jgi:hypothetical protein